MSNDGDTSQSHSARPHRNRPPITIIDFESNPYASTRITSPRSLQAIKDSGFIIEELYHLTFDQFKEQNPNIRALPIEIQKKRYQFYENNRKENIKHIIEIRELIDDKPKMNNVSKTASKFYTTYNSNSVQNDQKAFERMKAKNEMDLISMVRFEIQKELMRKEAQRKLDMQNAKKEQTMKEIQRKREEEEKKRVIRENERMRREEEKERELKEREKEKNERDRQKMIERMEMERKKRKESEKRQKEQEEKRIAFQEKVEMILAKKMEENFQRQKELQLREEERKKKIEEQRMMKTMENFKRTKEKQELIAKNQKNLEKQLKAIQNEYIKKDKQNELKRKTFEEQRQRKIQKDREIALKKEVQIQNVLKENELKEQKRIEEYNERQRQIEIKKKELEKEQQREKEAKEKMYKEKDTKIKLTIEKNEQLEMERKSKILERIKQREENAKQTKEEKKYENFVKSEETNQSRIIKEEKIKIISRQRDNEREKLFKSIEEKDKRINEFKQNKLLMAEKKKKMQNEIAYKKEVYTKEFQKLLSRKTIDESTVKKLKEMFPESKEIDDLIEMIKDPSKFDSKKKNRSTSLMSKSQTSHFSNTHNRNVFLTAKKENTFDEQNETLSEEQLTEEQIEKKVNQYKVKLNKELLTLLAEEKQNEELREATMSKLKTKSERRKMEREYGKERADASEKIIKKNEEIERKIKEYREKLISSNI